MRLTDAQDFRAWIGGICCGIGLYALVVVFMWTGYHSHLLDQAKKHHPISYAKVIQVGTILHSDDYNDYRDTTMSYRQFKFNRKMPWNTYMGEREPIVVTSDGPYVYKALDEEADDPRDPSDVAAILVTMFGTIVIGLGGSALFYELIARLMENSFFQLFLYPFKRIRRSKLWTYSKDQSHTSKTLRRLSKELGRMKPSPGLSAAKRKADELLAILEQHDNSRLETISATLDEINKDIALEQEARRLAKEELNA